MSSAKGRPPPAGLFSGLRMPMNWPPRPPRPPPVYDTKAPAVMSVSQLEAQMMAQQPAVRPITSTEPPGLPVQAVPAPKPQRIVPFTEQHLRAALRGDQSPLLEPFRKPEGVQHVGLMTASDKELIVRIQLSQLASIGELERPKEEKEEDRGFGASRDLVAPELIGYIGC